MSWNYNAIEKIVEMYFNNIPLEEAITKVTEELRSKDINKIMQNYDYIQSLKQGPLEESRGWKFKRLSINCSKDR